MGKPGESFTLIELLVVVVVIGILLLLLIPALRHTRRESEMKTCQENLSQIGKAMFAYVRFEAAFWPFSWMPADEGAPRRKDAMTGLGELYPCYLQTASCFRCPAARDRPFYQANVPVGAATSSLLRSSRNYTLVDSSYGYDCRVGLHAFIEHGVVADMDGSGGPSQNHRGAQNVLYLNGVVKRATANFCSNDPLDNIFAEDPWCADTDSFISDNKSPPRKPGSPADRYNDLGVSYDRYKELWPE